MRDNNIARKCPQTASHTHTHVRWQHSAHARHCDGNDRARLDFLYTYSEFRLWFNFICAHKLAYTHTHEQRYSDFDLYKCQTKRKSYTRNSRYTYAIESSRIRGRLWQRHKFSLNVVLARARARVCVSFSCDSNHKSKSVSRMRLIHSN